MKKVLSLIALLFLAAPLVRAQVTVPAAPQQAVTGSNPIPFDGNLNYYGASQYYVESSTPANTPVVLFTGKGFFYGVDCSSGTSGDFFIAMDTTAATNVTAALVGHALTPPVLSSVNGVTTCTAQGTCGVYRPAQPKRVVNGLIGIKSSTTGNNGGTTNCQISALSDAAISATTH